MRVTLHIDGGSRGNPGPAACAVIVRDAQTEKPLHEAGYFLGSVTNNVAEYQGLLHGLDVVSKMGVAEVRIFSDSELMVRQITGEYKVKSEELRPLHDEAQSRLLKIDIWAIRHVLRHLNKRADELANLSMDARKDVVVVDGLKPRPPETHEAKKPAPAPGSFVIPQLPTSSKAKRDGKAPGKTPARSTSKSRKKTPHDATDDEPLLPVVELDEQLGTDARVELLSPDQGDLAPYKLHPTLQDAIAQVRDLSPKWIARISEQPDEGQCPGRNRKGQMFQFGPSTPAGLCLYAAEAVLCDGPLCWDTQHADEGQVICPRCKIAIEIQRTTSQEH